MPYSVGVVVIQESTNPEPRDAVALSGAFDALPDLHAVVSREGVIQHVNNEWRRRAKQHGNVSADTGFPGVSYIEVCRRAAAEGVVDAARVLTGLEQVLRGDIAAFSDEYLLCGEPEPCWCEVHIHAIDAPNGGAVISHRDITVYKRAELLAARRLDELAHLQRAVTVGLLSLSTAHELKQPLTAILANAQAGLRLCERSTTQDQLRLLLRDIIADDQRAVDILEQIRSLLLKREREVVAVDLNAQVEGMARLLAREALARNIQLRIHTTSVLPHVQADPVQIQQVVLNLVLNGFDAMNLVDPGRRILTVWTRGDPQRVELIVEDRGPGVSDEVRQHLFEPFVSTRANSLGMGLSITKAIVEAHNGEITLEASDLGCRVRVQLPAGRLEKF